MPARLVDSYAALTEAQKRELRALADMTDSEIDTGRIPAQKDWRGAKCGVFFRPVKKQLTLRIDADLIDWFQTHTPNGKGYQTSINDALREFVLQNGQKP